MPFIVGCLLSMPWFYLVRLAVWQRIRAAKSPIIARNTLLAVAAIGILAVAVFTSLGIWARASGVIGCLFHNT